MFPMFTTNINPAIAPRLQKKLTMTLPQASRSFSDCLPPTNATPCQQPPTNCIHLEQRMNTTQEQAKLATQSGNAMQMRQAVDIGAELQKMINGDQSMSILHSIRANGANDNVAKQVEGWLRYQILCERAEHIVK